MPGAAPYTHDGGAVGALVLHGFTGSPRSMRPWAEALADAGLTVRLPRLPGHGTTWQDLATTRWDDWLGEAQRSFTALSERCDQVFVMALSMGGALALRLAELHGDQVRGLVLVNPYVRDENRGTSLLPVLKHVVPSVAGIGNDIAKPGADEGCYDRVPLKAFHSLVRAQAVVRADLAKVTQPLLVLRSADDHVVPASNTAYVLAHVGSADLTEQVLPRSYHVATLDHDAEVIVDASLAMVRRLAVPATGGR
jgi:carboxylesterase